MHYYHSLLKYVTFSNDLGDEDNLGEDDGGLGESLQEEGFEPEDDSPASMTIGKVADAVTVALKPIVRSTVVEACSGISQEVISTLKPFMEDTVNTACGKITVHANKSNGKAEQLVGECKMSVGKLQSMMEALTLKVNAALIKLDEVGSQARQVPTATVQARQACYFCDEEGHILMTCPTKICCFSCGSDLHRNEKCIHKEATCGKCGLVGHTATVHNTRVKELRKRLMAAHEMEFDHFLDGEDQPGASAGGQGGAGKRLGGRYGRKR